MIYIANYDNVCKKQYLSLNATECTIFFVIPSFDNTNWMVQEHATYNFPCKKYDVLKKMMRPKKSQYP
jgi:hypothetical protein